MFEDDDDETPRSQTIGELSSSCEKFSVARAFCDGLISRVIASNIALSCKKTLETQVL